MFGNADGSEGPPGDEDNFTGGSNKRHKADSLEDKIVVKGKVDPPKADKTQSKSKTKLPTFEQDPAAKDGNKTKAQGYKPKNATWSSEECKFILISLMNLKSDNDICTTFPAEYRRSQSAIREQIDVVRDKLFSVALGQQKTSCEINGIRCTVSCEDTCSLT
jgi:hypothetical protein